MFLLSKMRDTIRNLKQPVNTKNKIHIGAIVLTFAVFILVPILVFLYVQKGGTKPEAQTTNAVRGQEGDFWADVILGKRDFTEISSGLITPQKVNKPSGIVVDRSVSPGRAYVWDAHNSRILGIDLAKCYSTTNACNADIVIGQPSATDHGACNGDGSFQNYPERKQASASTLCGMEDGVLSTAEILSFIKMEVDSSGNLYVPDFFNNRILKFNSPFTTDTVADEVIGQDDFSGNECNKGNTKVPNASTICIPDPGGRGQFRGSGVALDPTGNIWIADNGNNRVLRFPKNTDGSFSKIADIVLGQANFTTGPYNWGNTLDRMANPNSLAFGPDGTLYVAEGAGSRILEFKGPFTSGMSASGTFGSGFKVPFIGANDPSGGGLWVNDSSNSRIILYDWSGVVKTTLTSTELSSAGLGIDTQGNILASFYSGASNVARYKAPFSANPPLNSFDRYLFAPLAPGNAIYSRNRLTQAKSVAIAGNQLFVSDRSRILFWNNPLTVSSGKDADGVLIQRDFVTLDGNLGNVATVKADNSGRIWAKTNKGIYVYQTPVVTGATPLKIIGNKFNVLGGGTITQASDFDGIDGLATAPDGSYLWITDKRNNRVFRLRDPLGSNPVVDIILGQANLSGTSCNRGQSFSDPNEIPSTYLCLPGALSIDKKGNLYVSDHSLETDGNWRLLMFSPDSTPANNSTVLFNIAPSKVFPKISVPKHATFEPAFDSTNRMVVGINPYSSHDFNESRFIPFYNDPTGSSATPNGWLKDFYSLPFGATFDSADNLYVADSNRSRVLIYKNPFGNTPQPSPVPTGGNADPTPSPSPSPTQSPSPTPSPSPSPPSSDTSAPSAPSNLTANAVSSSQINLSWSASSDNVGVSSYEVYRNLVLIAATSGNSTSFGNTGLTASTTYSYFVKAKDASGNVSPNSQTVSATTQAAPSGGSSGNLSGTVYSDLGGVVSGVKIEVVLPKGKRVNAVTSSSGAYFISNVSVGTWETKAEAKGYQRTTSQPTISGGLTTTQDFTLTRRGN